MALETGSLLIGIYANDVVAVVAVIELLLPGSSQVGRDRALAKAAANGHDSILAPIWRRFGWC